jgi:hypothetical protein
MRQGLLLFVRLFSPVASLSVLPLPHFVQAGKSGLQLPRT